MRQQQMQVAIDLKLPSNEILHFTGDTVLMTERDKIIGIANSITRTVPKSPFAQRG